MKKYLVYVPYAAFVTVEVEAESEWEAIEEACEKVKTPYLCHGCSQKIEIGGQLEDQISAEEI